MTVSLFRKGTSELVAIVTTDKPNPDVIQFNGATYFNRGGAFYEATVANGIEVAKPAVAK